MPLKKIETHGQRTWGLWKIEEDEATLTLQLREGESVPAQLIHPQKRLEWLAGRILTRHLLANAGQPYHGITKDAFGKPFPAGLSYQLSLSHSFPYVAAMTDPAVSVGIDLEQPKAKLLRIGPRILNDAEQASAGSDVIAHCILWCAKEVMVKIHGKKDLVFAENLQIEPFTRENEGFIVGRIIVDGTVTTLSLWYAVTPEFVVVMNRNAE